MGAFDLEREHDCEKHHVDSGKMERLRLKVMSKTARGGLCVVVARSMCCKTCTITTFVCVRGKEGDGEKMANAIHLIIAMRCAVKARAQESKVSVWRCEGGNECGGKH